MPTVPTILVVDDDSDIRKIVRMALERIAGWQVVEASSGEEALAMVETRGFDLVLVDQMMPGLTGAETIQKIRAGRSAEQPIIVISADGEETPAQELGCVGRIHKPFDPLKLHEQIAGLMGW